MLDLHRHKHPYSVGYFETHLGTEAKRIEYVGGNAFARQVFNYTLRLGGTVSDYERTGNRSSMLKRKSLN